MTQISLAKCKVDQLVSLCEEFGNQPGELINILHKAQCQTIYYRREFIFVDQLFRFGSGVS